MLPDPEKCLIIKNWPGSKSSSEVKSFLQTVQFSSKFLEASQVNCRTPNLQSRCDLLQERMLGLYGEQENQPFLKN